jgi:hypothetical protein
LIQKGTEAKLVRVGAEKRNRASVRITAPIIIGFSALLWSILIVYVVLAAQSESATADLRFSDRRSAGEEKAATHQPARAIDDFGVENRRHVGSPAPAR